MNTVCTRRQLKKNNRKKTTTTVRREAAENVARRLLTVVPSAGARYKRAVRKSTDARHSQPVGVRTAANGEKTSRPNTRRVAAHTAEPHGTRPIRLWSENLLFNRNRSERRLLVFTRNGFFFSFFRKPTFYSCTTGFGLQPIYTIWEHGILCLLGNSWYVKVRKSKTAIDLEKQYIEN